MKNITFKVGDKVKLDDYGIVKEYKITKISNNNYHIETSGSICCSASEEWLCANIIK